MWTLVVIRIRGLGDSSLELSILACLVDCLSGMQEWLEFAFAEVTWWWFCS